MSLDMAALYERYRHMLTVVVARHMRGASDDDIADVVQQAFTQACAAADRFEDRGTEPHSWLCRIAINVIRDRATAVKRRDARHATVPLDQDAFRLTDPSAEREYFAVHNRMALAPAISALPERQRAVILLRYFDDASTEQTASVLGTTCYAVKKLRARALVRLRKRLGEDAA